MARAVLFDFDGTISLIRAGWMDIMLTMMMETLKPLSADAATLHDEAEAYVARLTGKDTIFQMEAFAEHVAALGGKSDHPETYKQKFLDLMGAVRDERIRAIQSGNAASDDFMVPGCRALLDQLAGRGIEIYLASGTDHFEVCREAEYLGIAHYFGGKIFGAGEAGLSKQLVLERIAASGAQGEQIVAFGDGTVEIEYTKQAGGTAVGVASDERECLSVHPKKRTWLMRAGADFIIPNYLDESLLGQVIDAQ